MAYPEGYNAYHDGKSLCQNPYTIFTEAWVSWKTGWMAAREDSKVMA